MKAFAYVNAANEKEAIAALGTERGRFLPMAGGMDLLGLMKDYIVSPERVVNIKNLDATVAAADGGLRIGAAVKLVDLVDHAGARKLYPALTTAAEGVGTPQIRNMGTVGGNIMQRPRCWYFRNEEFHCLKKGGSRCYAVDGENQYHAIFGDGPCHIVHPSSLAVPVLAYGGLHPMASVGLTAGFFVLFSACYDPVQRLRHGHSLSRGVLSRTMPTSSRQSAWFNGGRASGRRRWRPSSEPLSWTHSPTGISSSWR